MDNTLARLADGKQATSALLRRIADHLDALEGPAAGESLVQMEHAFQVLALAADQYLGIHDGTRLRAPQAARPIGFMPLR